MLTNAMWITFGKILYIFHHCPSHPGPSERINSSWKLSYIYCQFCLFYPSPVLQVKTSIYEFSRHLSLSVNTNWFDWCQFLSGLRSEFLGTHAWKLFTTIMKSICLWNVLMRLLRRKENTDNILLFHCLSLNQLVKDLFKTFHFLSSQLPDWYWPCHCCNF